MGGERELAGVPCPGRLQMRAAAADARADVEEGQRHLVRERLGGCRRDAAAGVLGDLRGHGRLLVDGTHGRRD